MSQCNRLALLVNAIPATRSTDSTTHHIFTDRPGHDGSPTSLLFVTPSTAATTQSRNLPYATSASPAETKCRGPSSYQLRQSGPRLSPTSNPASAPESFWDEYVSPRLKPAKCQLGPAQHPSLSPALLTHLSSCHPLIKNLDGCWIVAGVFMLSLM